MQGAPEQSWRHQQMQQQQMQQMQQQQQPMYEQQMPHPTASRPHSRPDSQGDHLGAPRAPHPSIYAHQPHVAPGGPVDDEEAFDSEEPLASPGEPHDTALRVPSAPSLASSQRSNYPVFVPQPRNTMPLGTTNLVMGGRGAALVKEQFGRTGFFKGPIGGF
ncbi:hypothetical protein T492DRAFT_1025388 [Pavlovales sp. CCMP2436]|nr:hypothetical protein T492DRAFT_1025388 [Pavlovales sp. CCMP2436]